MQDNRFEMEMRDASCAAAEQIDWNSFVDLEYDPTVAPTSAQASPSTEGTLQQVLPSTEQLDHDGLAFATEDSSSLAALGFPSLDEWWADLPENLEQGPFDAWTGPSTSQGNTPHSDSNSSAYIDWQSPELQGEEGARKRRKRIPPEAKRLLAECFEAHKENPYIPKAQLETLSKQADLTLRQVQTYFANARARKLPRTAAESKSVDIPTPSQQQDPMQRFLSSSPEDEGLSEDAIRTAASHTHRLIKPLRPRKGITPSVRSSSQSSTSASSIASIDSLDSRGSRKGRKRQREPAQNVAKTIFRRPSSPSRKYQCTFCTHDFEQKYDWKRHEESVHFPQKEWVCMPNGPVEDSRCVFCGGGGVDEEHLSFHKSASCFDAPREHRTFQRKDKLVQHIKQVHGCGPPSMIKSWCRPIQRNVLLLCGFCSLELPDWKTRADHLSHHFSTSHPMTLWLPELIGGIWPSDPLTTSFVRERFSAASSPHGTIPCPLCAERFLNERKLTLHRRQTHDIYSVDDATIIMSKPSAGHHSQRLINLAQQTSRIQITRGGPSPLPSVSEGPTKTQGYPPAVRNLPPPALMPLGMRVALHQQRDAPLPSSHPLPPHLVSAKPHIPLTTTPVRKSALGRSSLRPGATAQQAGVTRNVPRALAQNSGTGPPVEAVRAILTRNREGVEDVGRPVQGMLYALEQGGGSGVWPKAGSRSGLGDGGG